jgi:hypothetical protein
MHALLCARACNALRTLNKISSTAFGSFNFFFHHGRRVFFLATAKNLRGATLVRDFFLYQPLATMELIHICG